MAQSIIDQVAEESDLHRELDELRQDHEELKARYQKTEKALTHALRIIEYWREHGVKSQS